MSQQVNKLEVTSVLCDFDQTTPFEVVSIFDEEMWMVGNPFAKRLEYSNARRAIFDHVSQCNKRTFESFHNIHQIPRHSRGNPIQKKTMFINTAGLFELISKSRMPKAMEFKSWINRNLLPKLCHKGNYSMVKDAPLDQAVQLNAIYQLTNNTHSEEPAQWFEDRIELEKANETIQTQKNEIIQMRDKMMDMKSRVAPMPNENGKRHVLRIMVKDTKPDEYVFCRTQQRSIEKSTKKAIHAGYVKKAFELTVAPNSMNVLNCIKEQLKTNKITYSSRKNRLSCDTDVVSMVTDLIDN